MTRTADPVMPIDIAARTGLTASRVRQMVATGALPPPHWTTAAGHGIWAWEKLAKHPAIAERISDDDPTAGLVSVAEAAELAGRSTATIRRWVRDELLEVAHTARSAGSPQFFDPDAVRALADDAR